MSGRGLTFPQPIPPFQTTLVSILIFRLLAKDGESVQNPPEDKNMDSEDTENNHRLPPTRNDLVHVIGQIPVERYQRDIQPVYDYPDYGVECPEPDDVSTSFLNPVSHDKGRKENEAENFTEEPMSVWSIQEPPVIIMGNPYHLQYKEDVHGNANALSKADGKAGKSFEEIIVGSVSQEA